MVMVVDDDPVIRMILSTMIKRDRPKLDIIECENGQDAFSKVSDDIEMIFTDNNMPILSGIEFLRKLKAEPMYSHIPVVMVSVEGREELKCLGKEIGVAGWIVKPFDMNQIHEYLKQFLDIGENSRI